MPSENKAILLFLEDLVSYMMNSKLLWRNTLYNYERVAPVAEEFREKVHNGFNSIVREATDVTFEAHRENINDIFKNVVKENAVCYNVLHSIANAKWKRYFPSEVDLEGFISYSIFMISMAGRFYRVGLTGSLDFMISFLYERFPYEEDSPEMWDKLDRAARNVVKEGMKRKISTSNDDVRLREDGASNVCSANANKCSCADIKIEGNTFKEVYEKRDRVMNRHFNVCSKSNKQVSNENCESISASESSERLDSSEQPELESCSFNSSVLTPVEILDNIDASRIGVPEQEIPRDFDKMTWEQKFGARPKNIQNDPNIGNKERYVYVKLPSRFVRMSVIKHPRCQSGPIQHLDSSPKQTVSPKSNLNKTDELKERSDERIAGNARLDSAGETHDQTVSQLPCQKERGEVSDSDPRPVNDSSETPSDRITKVLFKSLTDEFMINLAQEQPLEFPVIKLPPNIKENETSDEKNENSSANIEELQVRESLFRFQVKSFFENFPTPSKNSTAISEDTKNRMPVMRPLNNSPNEDNNKSPQSSALHHSFLYRELKNSLKELPPGELEGLIEAGKGNRQQIMKDLVKLKRLNRSKPVMPSFSDFESFPTTEKPPSQSELLEKRIPNDTQLSLERVPQVPLGEVSEDAELHPIKKSPCQENLSELHEQEAISSESLSSDSVELSDFSCNDGSSEYDSNSES